MLRRFEPFTYQYHLAWEVCLALKRQRCIFFGFLFLHPAIASVGPTLSRSARPAPALTVQTIAFFALKRGALLTDPSVATGGCRAPRFAPPPPPPRTSTSHDCLSIRAPNRSRINTHHIEHLPPSLIPCESHVLKQRRTRSLSLAFAGSPPPSFAPANHAGSRLTNLSTL